MRSATVAGIAAPRRNPRLVWLVAFLVVATAAITVLANGQPVIGLIPVLVTVGLVLMARLPLRVSAAVVLFLALVAHNPGGRPMMDLWHGPLYSLGVALYNNLRLVVGVDILRFCTLEVLLGGLAVVAALRLASPDEIDGTRIIKAPLALKVALVASFTTVVVLSTYGLATGGDFRQMLWQVRQIGWLPIITGLFIAAFRAPRSYRVVGLVVIAAAVLRSLEGLWFWATVAMPKHVDLQYLLTHEDSALFTVAITILLASLLERPTRATVALNVFAMPIITWALFMNGRRLAYVSLLFSAVALVLFVRPMVRRSLAKIALVLAPVVALYVVVGWSSDARIFAPITSLRSVGDDKNASNATRDIENYNLVQTTLESPLVGNGFGHPYHEMVKGPSIEQFMENYRYIAHNSVLWLWSLGGLAGFTLIWLPFTMGMFLAPRAYRASPDWMERVGILAAAAAMIAYVTQAYGDMGVTGWTTTLLVGAGLALIGNVTTLRGALASPPAPGR